MHGKFTPVDWSIILIEQAMSEVSKVAAERTGPQMYAANRVWHELKRAADDLRNIDCRVTVGLPNAKKTL